MYNGAAAIKILPVVATKRPLSLARCREKLSVSSDGTTGVSESTPGVSGAMAQTLSRPPGGICETSGAIRFVELHCGLGDRIWEEGNSDIRQLTWRNTWRSSTILKNLSLKDLASRETSATYQTIIVSQQGTCSNKRQASGGIGADSEVRSHWKIGRFPVVLPESFLILTYFPNPSYCTTANINLPGALIACGINQCPSRNK